MCNAADFWGELCAFLPTITSMYLRVAHLARPKFHQHLIRRETPIEAADEAIIDGAWVYGMVRAANFSLGAGHPSTFSPWIVDFSDSTVRLLNPPEISR